MKRKGSSAASSRSLAIRLFALTLLVYLMSGPPMLGNDGGVMFKVSQSLVLRHSLLINDWAVGTLSPYGLGTSLLLLPLVFIGNLLFNQPAALVLVYLPVVTALTVTVLWSLLRELGIEPVRSLWLSLIFGFATLAWHYTGVLFSEQLVMLLMLLAWYSLLLFRRSQRLRWLVIAGASLGFAVLTREDAALLAVLPFCLYAAWLIFVRIPDWRTRLISGLAYGSLLTVGVAAALAYDIFRYGRPLKGPYFTDWSWLATPLPKGIYGLLLSPGAGLFVFAPVLLLSLLGFPQFFRRWPAEAALIVLLLALRLVFYGTWYDWAGGATWGPRYLLPIVPFLVVPLAYLRTKRWEIILGAFALFSLAIELLDQFVPFGLYYLNMEADIAARLGMCHCVPVPGPDVVRLEDVIHFDPRYSPLAVQLRILLGSGPQPIWRGLGPVVPLAAVLIGAAASVLHRQARELSGGQEEAFVRRPRTSSATTS